MVATSQKITGARTGFARTADSALSSAAKGKRGTTAKGSPTSVASGQTLLTEPKKSPRSALRQSIKKVRVALAAERELTAPARSKYYAQIYLASPRERIVLIRNGVPALQLVDTGFDMGISKESLFSTLQFPRATINRKIAKNDVLPPEYSERMVGLQKLIGQVEVMVEQSGNPENFNAAQWVAQWLNEPLPALGNERPADFMDTVEGQELISSLLLQMQTGAYA